jgi:hypothetical protein
MSVSFKGFLLWMFHVLPSIVQKQSFSELGETQLWNCQSGTNKLFSSSCPSARVLPALPPSAMVGAESSPAAKAAIFGIAVTLRQQRASRQL